MRAFALFFIFAKITYLIMKENLERGIVMRLNSEECKKALREYQVKNDMETLAVKVLLTIDEDVVNIPELEDMSNDKIDELADTIGEIREAMKIEDIIGDGA